MSFHSSACLVWHVPPEGIQSRLNNRTEVTTASEGQSLAPQKAHKCCLDSVLTCSISLPSSRSVHQGFTRRNILYIASVCLIPLTLFVFILSLSVCHFPSICMQKQTTTVTTSKKETKDMLEAHLQGNFHKRKIMNDFSVMKKRLSSCKAGKEIRKNNKTR